MQGNNNINVFGFKDVIVNSIDESDEVIHVNSSVVKMDTCPHCGSKKIWVHDHRIHNFRDTSFRGKFTIFHLKKTRYNCKSCGKRFERDLDFIAKGHTITKRLVACIVKALKEVCPISFVARNHNVSSAMVKRILDLISISRLSLSEVLCIDEFKGDSGNHKYQCSLLNGCTHSVIDVLPTRDINFLSDYFKKIPKRERDKVKIFVSDMSKTFRTIKEKYFKNAIHIADRYHFIRQIKWALDNVRVRIQSHLPKKLRIYFKRSRSLLIKSAMELSSEEATRVSIMLDLSEELKLAYRMKELFYEYFLTQPNSIKAGKALNEWLRRVKDTGLKEFNACTSAFTNWFKEICNSFDYKFTNGPLEGTHTKIKTLKRNCFGMRNFERFRKRIMLVCK